MLTNEKKYYFERSLMKYFFFLIFSFFFREIVMKYCKLKNIYLNMNKKYHENLNIK